MVSPTRRRVSDKALAELKDSIFDVGLLAPISIAKQGTECRLLAGRRRFEACKQLGWTTIPARILDFRADKHAKARQELAGLDENLCREDLTELEFADALARKKVLYLQLYPETAHGKNPQSKDPLSGSQPHVPAFLDDTAQKSDIR